MTSLTPNIALFGTSADPPTLGHQKIIYWLSKYYDLVSVWTSNNPSKQHQVSLKVRSKMLGLLIEELNHSVSNVIFSPTISDRKTYNTIFKAQAIWVDAQFTFIVGSDVIKQISKWYQIDKILRQVKILIIPRIGYELTSYDLENLNALGAQYDIATLLIPEISSSQYRETKNSKLLTPSIQKYLEQNKFY